MYKRITRLLVLVAATALAAPAAPAAAGPTPGYSLWGRCEHVSARTPANRLLVTYGGAIVATGPQLAQSVYVRCDVSNAVGEAAYAESGQGGSVGATASVAGPWFAAPITTCVSGYAVFGPVPVVIMTLPKTCQSVGN